MSRTCERCFEPKPALGRCLTCHRRASLVNYHKRSNAPWPGEEVAALRKYYPLGGSAACKPYMPSRSMGAIHAAAKKHGLTYAGPRDFEAVKKPQHESPWPVPMHEYTEPDIALREWRCAMPLAAMRCVL